MENVLLIVLLIISIIMTGLILIQQSEGGALGIGGGGGGGGFMSGRSAANSVSRMTYILGTAFLICSLFLSVAFNRAAEEKGLIDRIEEAEAVEESADNIPALTVDPLTSETDSGETTTPLDDVEETTEAGTNPDENVSETNTDPAETPEDE